MHTCNEFLKRLDGFTFVYVYVCVHVELALKSQQVSRTIARIALCVVAIGKKKDTFQKTTLENFCMSDNVCEHKLE